MCTTKNTHKQHASDMEKRNLKLDISDRVELTKFQKNLSERYQLMHQHESSNKKPRLFIDPRQVVNIPGHITLGLTIINKKGDKKLDPSFLYKMKINLLSLLTYSSGDPIQFVIITDKNSQENVKNIMDNLVSQYTTEGVVLRKWRKIKSVPKIKFSYVDCEDIIQIAPDFFSAMRANSVQGAGYTAGVSYTEDLFYIAPIYHKAFASLDKIIFLDSKDLEFRSDVKLLEMEFDKMSETALIGIAPDLTPHYRGKLEKYLELHPNSSLGQQGPGQGYNSGVVLYRLDKMRNSTLYNKYTAPTGVDALMSKYLYEMFLAEQDWLTNLGFTHPQLFYNLPCQFNRQTSIR